MCVVKNCIVTDVTVSESSVTVMDIAASDGAVAVSDETLNSTGRENRVNPIKIGEILKSIDMIADELYMKILEFKSEHGMIEGIMPMASSSDDDEDSVFSRFTSYLVLTFL